MSPVRTIARWMLGAGLLFAGTAHLTFAREEFAAHLAADPTRFRMDSALAHVVTMAYQQGISDAAAPLPLAPGVGSNAAIQT